MEDKMKLKSCQKFVIDNLKEGIILFPSLYNLPKKRLGDVADASSLCFKTTHQDKGE